MSIKDFMLSDDDFASLNDVANLSPLGVRAKVMEFDDGWIKTHGGLIVPPSAAPKPKPTHFSAFAGIGGFDLGFKQAGFRTVGAFDWDIAASITYMHNLCSYPCRIIVPDPERMEQLNKALELWIFGPQKKDKKLKKSEPEYKVEWLDKHAGAGYLSHHPECEGTPVFIIEDARKLTGAQILEWIGMRKGEIDCMTGGPPCQGFSYAGRRNVADPRNNLVYEFARLICEMQPKTIVFENVPGIINMTDRDGVPVLDRFCFMLENGGYGVGDSIKKMLTGDSKAKMVLRGRSSAKVRDYQDPENKVDADPLQIEMFNR